MNQLVISNNGVQQSWQYFNIYIPICFLVVFIFYITRKKELKSKAVDIKIEDYSEKSFKVTGISTVKYKDRLKEFGKWNKNLKTGAGWIFPKSKKEKVYEILKI